MPDAAPVFIAGPFVSFSANPFAGIDPGAFTVPTFADLDGDGDLDLVVGNGAGTLLAYQRTASGFTTFASNPFAAITVPSSSTPAFADLDGDGDLDLVVGSQDGKLVAYQRTVSGFAVFDTNPFATIDVGKYSAPAFADLDGDGDLDLAVGEGDGTLLAYERQPAGFVIFATNPLPSIDVGLFAAPAFVDLDGDGDLDLVVGKNDGTLLTYERTAAGFTAFATNPFAGIDVGTASTPAFADLDGDGDLDLVSGRVIGTLLAYENRTNAATFAENATGTVFQRIARDPEGGTVTYALSGTDAALFTVDGVGAVRFRVAPNFEAPQDDDGDNVYDLTLTASDGVNGTPLAISVTVTDVDEAPVFAAGPFVAFAPDPFPLIDAGFESAPAFVDLDGDGDLDLVLGNGDGDLVPYRRTASGFTLLFPNPLSGVSVVQASLPTFTDLDGDGDLDLVLGNSAGTLLAWERTPSGFVALANSPLDGIDVGEFSAPVFTDLDGDGDLDLVVGEQYGTLLSYQRTASGFVVFASNPFAGIDAGGFSVPTFTDLDGDGDLDLVIGNEEGTLQAWERTASGFAPFAGDPFTGIDAGRFSTPAFTDLDGDGDLDLVSGRNTGTLLTYRNQAPPPAVTFAENATGIVFQRSASDPEGGAVTYALSGADAALFAVDSVSGAVSFRARPDFEIPQDAGRNNVYDVIVTASDGVKSTPLVVAVTVTDVNEAPGFRAGPFVAFAVDPFAGIDAGYFSTPAFADLDGDGDLDLVSGEFYGQLLAYERTATGFVAFATNPFAGIDVDKFSRPTFADLDGDGDLDLVSGAYDGTLPAYERTATAFLPFAPNPFAGIDVGFTSAPAFTDLDGDGDLDLVIGEPQGSLLAYERTATGFVPFATNPFAGIDVGDGTSPTFADLDGDGDLDLVIGELFGQLLAYERTVSGFEAFATNPFAGIDVGRYSAPAFADLDGDGDLDLVSGANDGKLFAFENRINAATFAENATGTVFQRTAEDPEGGTVTYSLSGADAALFAVDSVSGAVSFRVVPNFENPQDAGGDNVYDFILTASDGVKSTPLAVAVTVTDVNEAPVFAAGPFVAFAVNPFAGIDGDSSAPAFADLDGDGALDLVTGDYTGALLAYRREGSDFVAFATNPLAGISVSRYSAPAFTDLDGDGDLDLVVGADDGTLRAYERQGATFALFASDPFAGIDVGLRSKPAFADLDGDGDLDLVVGNRDGTLQAFERQGSTFTVFARNPFAGIDTAFPAAPAFADLDGDGDADLVLGSGSALLAFARTGESTVPGFTEFLPDPVAGVVVGTFSTPSFTDLDGDGDPDLVVGSIGGTLLAFENQAASSAARFAENATGTVFQRSATDPEGGTVTYALSGADAARFAVDSLSGAVAFVAPPDFETPQDAGADNVYDVIVTASDGVKSTALAITVTVTDVNEAPTVAAAIADQPATEDAPFAFTFAAGTFTDIDAGDVLTYSAKLASGAALPAWLAFDGATRSFSGTPANDDVGAITVRVTATDLDGLGVFDDFVIAIANTNDAPTGEVRISLADALGTLLASDTLADDDGLGSIAYRWQAYAPATWLWSDIPGATGATLAPGLVPPGTLLRVVVSYTDARGTPEEVASDTTARVGTAGGDVLAAAGARSLLAGLGGADTLLGGNGADSLYGGDGNDLLEGAGGNDLLEGGGGRDRASYAGAAGGVTVSLALGTSSGGGLGADSLVGIEDLTGGSGNDTLAGDGLDNRIDGASGADSLAGAGGADTLDGGLGADSMAGGSGDDVFVVDAIGDRVAEAAGEGVDLVLSSVGFSLVGQAIENLVLTGLGDIGGTGNALANRITGNAGNNAIDGGAGADTMAGGGRNDSYVVDDAGDRVIELAGEGTDLVQASVSYSLAGLEIENLVLTGGGVIDGFGNGLANQVTGNGATNWLTGEAGADTLIGNGGADTIVGGGGKDLLFGGSGMDRYLYAAVSDSAPTAADRDVIADWAAGDAFDLTAIDANTALAGHQSFVFRGVTTNTSAAAAGEIWVYQFGGSTYVIAGVDADGVRDFQVEITGLQTLVAGSFVNTAMAVSGGAGIDVLAGGGTGDTLSGLGGADSLAGNGGDDSLAGGDDADTLLGGDGADTLAGGGGKDLLQGNAGADRYVFGAVSDSPPTASRDVIGGWAAGELIDLSLIDANTTVAGNQAFVFKGVTANTSAAAAGEVWVYQYGGNTYVIAGVDADGVRDLQIEISNPQALAAGDFVL